MADAMAERESWTITKAQRQRIQQIILRQNDVYQRVPNPIERAVTSPIPAQLLRAHDLVA